MVIDFHTHIFPDAIATKSIAALERISGVTAKASGTVDGLLASMEQAEIDLSVILPVATKPSQFESVNRFACQINEQYKGRLLSFGGIHPDCENYRAELDAIREMGLPGIKIHPDYQQVMIDDIRYLRIMEYASELGLIIVTHAGIDIGYPDSVHCPPERMRKVLDQIKPQKMVLAHMGGWNQWEQVYECLAGEPVYLDTAFSMDQISQEMFGKIWEKHDKDKILFATDSPWSDQKKDLSLFRGFPLSEAEKEAILCGNAKKLLGMV